jgi:hypothetical protein
MRGNRFFSLVNPTPSTAVGPVDATVKGILDLDAVWYLPPLAKVTTKSGRTRTVDLKTGILREDTGDTRHILILMQEHTAQL